MHQRLLVAHVPNRFHFLDALRGIAALLVVVFHAGNLTSPAFAEMMRTHVHLGHAGVILFFLCSGFIIPASLERQGSLRCFWIRRVCRLYPLYWMTCGLVGLLSNSTSNVFLFNLTMAPGLFNASPLLVVFWTLEYELVFYVLVSAVFALRIQRYQMPLAVGILVAAHGVPNLVYLGLMYAGTLARGTQEGTVSRRTAAVVAALTASVLVATAWSHPEGTLMAKGYTTAASILSARFFAIAMFGLALHMRRWPPVLIQIGTVSYSMYLLHALVFVFVPAAASPLLTTLLWLAVTLLVSAATYRWIEQPGITLGRRLTARPTVPYKSSAPDHSCSRFNPV